MPAAVDEQRQVEFLGDVDAVGDIEAVDLLAVLAGLDRDERIAEHVGRRRAHLVQRLRQPHAAFRVGAEFLELALAAPAGMDLRLHDVKRSGQLLRRFDRLVDRQSGKTGRDGDAELGEQFLGLVFVDVHGRTWRLSKNGNAPGLSTVGSANPPPLAMPRGASYMRWR